MRTKGILLVRDAILLLAILPSDGERYMSTPLVVSAEVQLYRFQGPKLGSGGSHAIRF